jgi:hypothetical protein
VNNATEAGGGELVAQLATLAVDQTTVRRRLDTLTEQVADNSSALAELPTLAAAIRALAKEVAALQAPPADPEPPLWDWAAMSTKQAAAAWETLTDWVREVLIGVYRLVDTSQEWRQPTAADDNALRGLGLTESATPERSARVPVPRCWFRHPDVVAELGWLCQSWLETFRSPAGRPTRAADWHDRYLPGVLRRINSTSTAAACLVSSHKDPPAPGGLDNAALSEAIRADLEHRT